MAWNGLDLQTEFSNALGDTSTAFKGHVLDWMNEVQDDICSRHNWTFLRVKGKKVLTSNAAEQLLTVSAPGAATAAISSGGSLTEDSTYKVLITFVESNGIESEMGAESAESVATAVNKTIDLTSIPVSTDPLVTSRKIYVATKASGGSYGSFLYSATISDNTTTTTSITTEPTSTVEPPDYPWIRSLDGSPFFESSPTQWLRHKSKDQINLISPGGSTGTPEWWDEITPNKVLMYPAPSSATTVSFNAFRVPARIFAESDSQPTIPIWLKSLFKLGVLAKGYEYRERDGWVNKASQYENSLKTEISRTGSTSKKLMRVRDVYGNSEGFEI